MYEKQEEFDEKYINNTEWDAPYFIGDITSKIYCFPWCENVQKEQNITVFKSRKEVMHSGYLPCKIVVPFSHMVLARF